MAETQRRMFGNVMSGLCAKMNRIKRIDGDMMETPLKRCLTTFDLTLLGVGHMIGAGIYVLTGTVAHSIAGPGVILSFLLAGIASILSAFCYAEFGARVPKAGSAYVYTYVAIGEFWAFIIGWNIILEHMIGAASVARAWSGYVDSLADGTVSNFTRNGIIAVLGPESISTWSTQYLPDPLAAAICIFYAFLLACGVKGSAIVNSILTVVNLGVMALVIGLGFVYADINNWGKEYGGFLPWGLPGVVAGAGTCFYAFVGFDSIATAGEEAKNPGRSIPLATAFSLAIVIVGYILVSGTLTLVVPFSAIKTTAALPEAFASKGVYWAKYVVSIGALCGMTTTLFGSLFSLPRIMYAMASDGLLFSAFGRISERTQLPMLNLVVSGGVTALIALVFDLHQLIEFMSIGTFLAYTIVSASVVILRYKPEPVIVTVTGSVPGTPSDIKSPSTEGADSNSDCNSIHRPLASSYLDFCGGTGRLRPSYRFMSRFIGDWEPGTAVVAALIIFIAAAVCLSLIQTANLFTGIITVYLAMVSISCLVIIAMHKECPPTDKFRVPLIPLVPALSIQLNIYLMVHLSSMTWFRFVIWMFIGMFIYFLYGIHNSGRASGQSAYSTLMSSAELEKATKCRIIRKKSKEDSEKDPIIGSDDELLD